MNTQILLAKRPNGMLKDTDFDLKITAIPTISEGQILIKNEYISLDPAMRGWMNEGTTYIPGVALGSVMRAFAAGQVVESKNPDFTEGAYVVGLTGAQTYSVSDGRGLSKVDLSLGSLSGHLGILGMPGMTAYFGLLDAGLPKDGDTVVASGATGAVGATVGQIAKIKGCRAVGIAGGPEKCDYAVNTLGYDACIDYKNQDVRKGLKEHCPKGVDVYFDNVGGEILDTVLTRTNLHARDRKSVV